MPKNLLEVFIYESKGGVAKIIPHELDHTHLKF